MRQINSVLSAALLSIVLSACRPDESFAPRRAHGLAQAATSSLSPDDPERTRNKGKRFTELNSDSVWSLIVRSDSIADIGLKHPAAASGMSSGVPLLDAAQREAALEVILAVGDAVLVSADTLLPIARVRIPSRDALERLRQNPLVSYVEPGRFVFPAAFQNWGCGANPYSGPASSTIAPGDVLPWNYTRMQIPDAWPYANGYGITVGLTDTGVDGVTDELNGGWQSGMSAGRLPITRDFSIPGSNGLPGWYDVCAHGTKMASIIAGPRNGQNIVGVAWKADLHSVRVDDNVVIEGSVAAHRDGIRRAATTSRIIAMAWGTPEFQYSSIVDEISYWYTNFDRLFVAAAGTTPCTGPGGLFPNRYVVFPANQNMYVTAVTRLDPDGQVGCDAHWGPDVDFAAFGNQPSTYASGMPGFSGSSNAVAVISGLAALEWSRRPHLSRSSLMSALIYSASPTGSLRHDIGWGAPNALCLVQRMCTAWVDGPSLVEQTSTHTFTARQAASTGPFSYSWSTGASTPSIQRSYFVGYGTVDYLDVVTVTITDLSDGRQRTVSKSVFVRNPYPGCPTCF